MPIPAIAIPALPTTAMSDTSLQAATLPDIANCTWGEYGEWSLCSSTCGHGTKERIRTIIKEPVHGGTKCTGANKETEDCFPGNCSKPISTPGNAD